MDPTTAVQALNEIEDLLLRLGRRRLEIGTYRDSVGNPKLLLQYPLWEDFLRLAFDEIRFYGANSVQVRRRMKALITELLSILPEERCAALSTGKCGCNPRWRICHGEFHEGCHLPRVVHLSRCDGQRSEADCARTGSGRTNHGGLPYAIGGFVALGIIGLFVGVIVSSVATSCS